MKARAVSHCITQSTTSSYMRSLTQSILALAAILGPLAAEGQAVTSCPEGLPVTGDIGLGALRCVGASCAVNLHKDGTRRHEFNTEPIIAGVVPGSPSARVLHAGDTLEAVDGSPITTRRAGEKLANLVPGVPLVLTVRRAQTSVDVRVVPVRGCNFPSLTVTGGR